MSSFDQDLIKEQLLGNYLDTIYHTLNLDLERTQDLESQLKGIDLTYKDKKNIFIDEKAQLDYINTSLPTFTFELSYLKNNRMRVGWLLDSSKVTTHYFLITGIYAQDKKDLSKGITKCIITSINRAKLLNHLTSIGLTKNKLVKYDKDLRDNNTKSSKHPIGELNPKKEGLLYFSQKLSEKPINLQLRLNYLINIGVAKKLYPISR